MKIEEAVEFILNAQANFGVELEKSRDEPAKRAAEHDREMAEIRAEIRQLARSGRQTDARLRRAISLGVREARAERAKRREMDERFDEKITQLAAAHLLTEEALKNHIAHHSNGK
jgi:hypothetical protein